METIIGIFAQIICVAFMILICGLFWWMIGESNRQMIVEDGRQYNNNRQKPQIDKPIK